MTQINSGFETVPGQSGSGYDYFAQPDAPQDVLRFWIAGETYPRIVLDPQTYAIKAGDGTREPNVVSDLRYIWGAPGALVLNDETEFWPILNDGSIYRVAATLKVPSTSGAPTFQLFQCLGDSSEPVQVGEDFVIPQGENVKMFYDLDIGVTTGGNVDLPNLLFAKVTVTGTNAAGLGLIVWQH